MGRGLLHRRRQYLERVEWGHVSDWDSLPSHPDLVTLNGLAKPFAEQDSPRPRPHTPLLLDTATNRQGLNTPSLSWYPLPALEHTPAGWRWRRARLDLLCS